MSAPSQSSTPRAWVYLVPNPKSAYKQLLIKGTRIRADVVYCLSIGREPMTPEEIAADYGLPLEAVQEAIAYGASDPCEIEADRRGEERVMQTTGMNAPDYKRCGKYKILSPQESTDLGLEGFPW